MIKFITQQRRGTTAEWNQFKDTIIAAGEIVIEECGDHVKIKVGNGITTFENLPYITKKIDENINTIISRINNIIALPEGSTMLDAEIADIRVGYGGIQYDSAGDAVRAIGEEVSTLADSLKNFINAEAVDGLLYENNLLYLTAGGVIVSEPVEVKGGSGGGGSVSSTIIKLQNKNDTTAMTITEGSPAILKFTFTSTEDDIPTGDGICTITVNDVVKNSFNITQGDSEINVADYLSLGANNVKVTCTDLYGNYRVLVYSISVIQLSISSIFDSSITYSSDITFKYTPYGAIEKDIHFIVDGTEIAKTTITTTAKQTTQILPAMSHGVHTLVVYASVILNGQSVESNHLVYDIMCIEADDDTPMIASVFTVTNTTQGERISIPYNVYDPTRLASDIVLTISYTKSGESIVYSTQELTVDRSRQYWNTRNYPLGNVTFTITYGKISKSHTVYIDKSDLNIEAETNDLELHLTSANRSNDESYPGKWEYNGITSTFTGFNWENNGWIVDTDGDTCLRLTGDSRVEINYKPFEKDFREYGKTIEIEFAIRDVNNRDAVVLDCLSNGIGMQITADTATLKSQLSEIKCRYNVEEKIRVSFTIDDISELSARLICIYIDGVLSGAHQYTVSDNFEQNPAVNIKLGSSYCGLDIYNIRIYDTSLTPLQITNNYIADLSNVSKKQTLYENNDIYDDALVLSYDKIKAKIPTITFVGSMPTFKGDKKKNSVRMIFEHPEHPELNFDEVLAQIDVQGTSSQYYVRKNWKTKHNDYHQHMVDELEAKIFCIKVDYAEATGTHNTQNANFIETLYTEKIPPQKVDKAVRTTIAGFPCVIFEKATDDSMPVFSSKANFNYDKGAENVFGFTSDYDTECWEFCNNTSAVCNFISPIINPDDHSTWKDDFEARYPEESTEIGRFKVMHDWVVSTRQDAATNELLESPYTDVDGHIHTNDTAEYRLAKFKTEFTQYFNMHYSSIYYVYTFFALMVDQRAKNMFLTYWDGKYFPYFYDNDTSFGINNEGDLVFDYWFEDTDRLNDANVYNGQNSTLWVNFREAFPDVIAECYKTLRQSKLNFTNLINQFIFEGSNRWSASIYNEDAEYKYVTMARPTNAGVAGDVSNLYQIKGSGEHYFRYFVANRLNYCDSKWNCGEYPDNNIFLRIYTPVDADGNKLELAVPANPSITVTPFSNMYAGVKYKANGTMLQKRLAKNDTYTFSPPTNADGSEEIFNDTETAIYGASELSSLGDLSALYCGVINVSKATKLVELQIGNHTEGYANNNLRELSIGTNKLLKKLDVTNCVGLTQPLAVSGCPNIEYIYAKGTSISGIDLPKSGYLRVLHLPETITNLTITNQLYITDLDIESYENIKTLCIDNCPTLDTVSMLEQCVNAERVRLTNVHWNIPNISFLQSLYHLKGLNENGINTNDAYLIGSCHIEKLTGSEMLEIKSHYPYLDITFDELECTVVYMDSDGVTELYREKVYNGADAIDPVLSGLITPPSKESTTQYIFTWCGWSKKNNGIIQEDVNKHVVTDLVLYPAFTTKLQKYTVIFYNDKTELYRVVVPYGSDAIYPESFGVPVKENTLHPDMYEFSGWYPSPSNITGMTKCYAQYYLDDSEFYKIQLSDIEYETDADNKTISLTSYNNTAETIAELNHEYMIDGDSDTYTVTSITGYDSDNLDIDGFRNSGIEIITLPDSLEVIGPYTFADCSNLTQVNIPKEVKTINELSFANCTGLQTVKFNAVNATVDTSSVPLNDVIYSRPFEKSHSINGFELIVGDEVTKIPSYLFYQSVVTPGSCVINKITFGENSKCTEIGSNAFIRCNLRELTLPNSLIKIGSNAFNTNYDITQLTIPDNVTTIGSNAFQGWNMLKTVKLPRSLTNLEIGAFKLCGEIESFEIDSNNKTYIIQNSCIINKNTNTLVHGCMNSVIPTGGVVAHIEEQAFSGVKHLKTIEIPSGITSINNATFSYCTELTDIILPNTVQKIDSQAFYECKSLVNINLPESITRINSYAFAYCSSLTEITIPDSVTYLGSSTFNSCDMLTKVTIKSPIIEIGKTYLGDIILFNECNNLTEINVAWAEGDVEGAPWGAPSNVKINYNYTEE